MAKKKFSQEKILKFACEMTYETGLEKFSMRKLADRIGCSVMPVY